MRARPLPGSSCVKHQVIGAVKLITGMILHAFEVECPCSGHRTAFAKLSKVALSGVVLDVALLMGWFHLRPAVALVGRMMEVDGLVSRDLL